MEFVERPYRPRGPYKKKAKDPDALPHKPDWDSKSPVEWTALAYQDMLGRCGWGCGMRKDGIPQKIRSTTEVHHPGSYTQKQGIEVHSCFLDMTPETRVVREFYRGEVRDKEYTKPRGFWVFYETVGLRRSHDDSVERMVTDVKAPVLQCHEGHYHPLNIIWATPEAQANNKTTNRMIVAQHRGVWQENGLTVWQRITGIPAEIIAARIDKEGMTPTQAVNTRWVKPKNKKGTHGKGKRADDPLVPSGAPGEP